VRRSAAGLCALALTLSFALATGLGCTCSQDATHGSADATVAVVTGTVLDARTGEPVEDAHVRGPHDTRARSDARGRFELRGLQLGDTGELRARAEDGRTGMVALRPLRGGVLEVVLHVAKPAQDE
jgi:hypothetical protein